MNTKFKDFPRGYTEDQLLFLIWKELSGGESGEAGLMNSGRRGFPDGLDRKDLLYLIWKALSGGKSLAEVSDITAIPASVLDDLNVGDAVAKVTGKKRHLYVVTYKGEGEGEGICLTYAAAGYGETVSYDRSGSSWVYNSTDVETYSGDGGGGGGCDCPEIEPNAATSLDDIDTNLLSLKIGDTTYLIPGGVWIVPCTLDTEDNTVIVPNGISFAMVVDAFIRGYNVMFVEERQDGEQNYYKPLSFFPESTDAPSFFEILVDAIFYDWCDPNWQDGGGGEEPAD